MQLLIFKMEAFIARKMWNWRTYISMRRNVEFIDLSGDKINPETSVEARDRDCGV